MHLKREKIFRNENRWWLSFLLKICWLRPAPCDSQMSRAGILDIQLFEFQISRYPNICIDHICHTQDSDPTPRNIFFCPLHWLGCNNFLFCYPFLKPHHISAILGENTPREQKQCLLKLIFCRLTMRDEEQSCLKLFWSNWKFLKTNPHTMKTFSDPV